MAYSTSSGTDYWNYLSKLSYCIWRLQFHNWQVNTNQYFQKYQLNILHFNNSNSSFDSLTLYDGDSKTANVMGKYCGNLIPPNLYSSSNMAFMHFSSNGYRTEKGFKLQYHPYSEQTNSLLHCFWSFHVIVFFQLQHFSWKHFTIHVNTLKVYFFSDLPKSDRIFLSPTWQICSSHQLGCLSGVIFYPYRVPTNPEVNLVWWGTMRDTVGIAMRKFFEGEWL